MRHALTPPPAPSTLAQQVVVGAALGALVQGTGLPDRPAPSPSGAGGGTVKSAVVAAPADLEQASAASALKQPVAVAHGGAAPGGDWTMRTASAITETG
jgi:hypothetical protein